MSRKIRKSDVVRVKETKVYVSAEPWGMGKVYWLSKDRPRVTEGELDFRTELGEFMEPSKVVSEEVVKLLLNDEDISALPELFIAEVSVESAVTVYDGEGGVFTKWEE